MTRRPQGLRRIVVLAAAIIVGVATFGLVADVGPSPIARAQPAPTPTTAAAPAATTAEPPGSPTTTAVSTTAPSSPTSSTIEPSPSTTAATTVSPTTTRPAPPPTTVGGSASEPEPAPSQTTLPPGPPEGFTEAQFQTFVEVVQACGTEPGSICTWVLGWTGNQAIAEAAQWTSDVPVRVLIVIGAALAANWLVRRAIARYLRRLQHRSEVESEEETRDYDRRRLLRTATASASIASAGTVVIFTIAAFVALAQLDIDLGPLLAGAGIIGVALGFGAQNLVRDVLAGLFVLVEDQYGIGDIIDVGRASGTVEGISLRVTKLRDVEGTLWFVPNGMVEEVGNKTQRWSRVILDVDVAYGADHHEAARLIKEAADSVWHDPDHGGDILEEPEMWGVEALGDSSVSLRVAVKSAPADQWKVARELRSRIKDRFDAAGIEIPFPQQTVWVRSESHPEPERIGS